MQEQSYKNHIRFYAAHHFVFYPLLLVLLGSSIFLAYNHKEQRLVWIAFAVILFLLGWLSFMMRQHYALRNQDRIVRLEMRFRYFTLTGQRLEPLEQQLTFGQIAALRFASDEELPILLQRALAEHLSAPAIKRAVVRWAADYMRV